MNEVYGGGECALHAVVRWLGGNLHAMVCVLLEHKADVLHWFSLCTGSGKEGTLAASLADPGYLESFKLLFEANADVNTTVDFYGNRTVLHSAANGASPNMVQLLLDHGANVNATDRENGRDARM
jgi:ankyrin repeat protein